jgi:predicted nucleotidyltransferase
MANFDSEAAKKFLGDRERKEKEENEETRKTLLQKVIIILKEEFHSPIEIYLIGSILRPYSFSTRSDIDIVIKNYHGDRFDLWTNLEKKFERKVEIILFETCPFQEFVLKEGLKVV